MKNLHYKTVFLLVVLMLTASYALADSVNLKIETDRSILLAGQKQTTYVRVGLTGCPLSSTVQRSPVNIAIVIDKSGSMSGEKIQKAKEAAILALYRLKSSDIVSVVLYDSKIRVLVPATRMTDRDMIISQIRQVNAGGSTALYGGVRTGSKEVKKFLSKEYVNRVVLLSDGLANVGPDTPEALGKLGSELVEDGISVTTVGLGLGYNEDLMSRLADRSDGGHYFAEDADELASVFDHEFGRALSVVAQDVKIEIICGEGMRPVRLLGREGDINGRTVMLDINNIYSDHEKYFILEVEIPSQKIDKVREVATVRMNYQDLQSKEPAKSGISARVRFSESQEESDASLNKRMFADVVEQIAIINNQKALELRDAGKVQEAKQLLYYNRGYLNDNYSVLDSEKLKSYAEENGVDADNLEGENWNYQRKSMRESQSMRQKQR